MRRGITKIILLLLVAVFALSTATYAKTQAPAWVRELETGEKVVPPTKEEIEKQEELEKWREEKKSIKVPILLYHHITEESFDENQAISLISPSDFRLHMTAIKANFTPISLRQYYEYVKCDDASLTIPKNPIIVTFDDGYLSNYEIAYPILKELEIPATIFVVTDTVGAIAGEGKVNNSHFSWEQAREMEKSGLIDIQSHTVNHIKVAASPFAEQVRQIRKSKYDIEKNLGHTCDMIAYPYGDYDESVKQVARYAGYNVQLLVDDKTTEDAYDVNVPTDGVENLTRMTIAGSMGNVNVIEIIRRTISKKKIK